MNDIAIIEKPATSALATVEALIPAVVFAPGGIKGIVDALKIEVRFQIELLDVSTEKGRKQIASLAYKVAQSKTALDKMGKDLTADWQKQTNLVNEDRRYLRDELDALKAEASKALDDYKAADAARIAAHETALSEIAALASTDGLTAEQISERIWSMPVLEDRQWQEFTARATRALESVAERLRDDHAAAVEREETEALAIQERVAEEARIAAENEAKRIAREQEIAANARALAIMEAEAEAERVRLAGIERERVAKEKAEQVAAQVALEAERNARAARELAAQAQAKAAQAEADRIASEQRAERAKIEAAAQAKRDQAAAVVAERKRLADIEAAKQAEADKRAANVAHRARVNRDALADIVLALSEVHAGTAEESETLAKAIVTAIAKGAVRHIQITY